MLTGKSCLRRPLAQIQFAWRPIVHRHASFVSVASLHVNWRKRNGENGKSHGNGHSHGQERGLWTAIAMGACATTLNFWSNKMHADALHAETVFPYNLLPVQEVKEPIRPAVPHRQISNPILRFLFQTIPESVKTVFRVLQLGLIFLPPLLTWPVAFLGKIIPGKGVKSGTLWWYNTLVHSMELAGPTFIKLAQWAATRVDIFPPQLCAALARLQSEVKPHSLQDTRRIIREQFAADIEDLFLEFSDKPVGVGAIAQVYSARLKSEYAPAEVKKKYGSDEPIVAVKVLHPKVGGQIYRDLRIITFGARLVHLIPLFSSFNLPDQVSTFGAMMKQQLDLTKEAENIENFRGIWKTRQDVCFPEIIWPYVTEKALIESFEFGVPMKMFLKDGYTTVMDEWLATMGLDTLLVRSLFRIIRELTNLIDDACSGQLCAHGLASWKHHGDVCKARQEARQLLAELVRRLARDV